MSDYVPTETGGSYVYNCFVQAKPISNDHLIWLQSIIDKIYLNQAVILPKDVEMKIIDANLKHNEITYTTYTRGTPMNETKIDETRPPNPLPDEIPAGVTLSSLGNYISLEPMRLCIVGTERRYGAEGGKRFSHDGKALLTNKSSGFLALDIYWPSYYAALRDAKAGVTKVTPEFDPSEFKVGDRVVVTRCLTETAFWKPGITVTILKSNGAKPGGWLHADVAFDQEWAKKAEIEWPYEGSNHFQCKHLLPAGAIQEVTVNVDERLCAHCKSLFEHSDKTRLTCTADCEAFRVKAISENKSRAQIEKHGIKNYRYADCKDHGFAKKLMPSGPDPYGLAGRIAAATKQHKVDLDRKVKPKYPDTQDYSSWKKI